MFKKIFISFLIVAFFNLVMSCSVTTSKKVFQEELSHESEKIHELILTNAEVITFDSYGGTLLLAKDLIVGTSTKSGKIDLPLTSISKVSWIDSSKSDSIYTINAKQLLKNIKDTKQNVDLQDISNLKITEIVTKNDSNIIFDENGGRYTEQEIFVTGTIISNEYVQIAQSQILYVRIEKSDVAGSILASFGVLVGIILLIGLIAAATKQSCPFVYSYDGEKYVFDAEPLGGATTKGLERTELSKLEHLKPVDGKYKLLVKNEVPETQHIDKMSMLVVDHPIESKVYADLLCDVNVINAPQEVLFAKDEHGSDISNFVKKEDDVFWQTKIPFDTTKFNNDLRHQLTLAFPKPNDKKKAKLIINAGTSLWGSQMIREMQTLYGDYIDTWYEQIDKKGIEKEQMMQFIEREELYIMKALVKEDESWVNRSLINGGGPFIVETRTYDLDLQNVVGDTLFIKFSIPYGFWTLDYAAIDYGNYSTPIVNEIELSKAINHNEEDILTTLLAKDDNYYVMPIVGEYFLAEFDAPSIKEGYERTLFLNTNGFYKLHLKKDQPMQMETLVEIISEPKKIVSYSIDRFSEWQNEYKKGE